MIQALEQREVDTRKVDAEASETLGKHEQKHRFVVLRAKGYTYARIARELGVSKGTLLTITSSDSSTVNCSSLLIPSTRPNPSRNL